MPSLRDLLEYVSVRAADAGHPLPDNVVAQIEAQIRVEWPTQRVYIAPADSKRDPSRTESIRRAAQRLPVGVVAQRHGVTPQWVYRVLKTKR